MVNWWMATAEGAGYEKLFPGLMTYFYTAEYYDANIEAINRSVQNLIAAKRPIKGFLHMGDSILTHDTWGRLGEIKTPTLLMGGEEDIITPPRHMVEMAKLASLLYCRSDVFLRFSFLSLQHQEDRHHAREIGIVAMRRVHCVQNGTTFTGPSKMMQRERVITFDRR